jgi:ABC-type amino acid transport substrate-binding protein
VVGLDMDIINDLARDLRVSLEVVRLDLTDAEAALEDGSIDLLVGGIAVTPARASVFAFTNSYLDQTLALIVRDHDRDRFANLSSVAERSELNVAMMKSDYYEDAMRGLLPNATVTEVESPREFLRGELEDVDALVYSAETGAAWTLIYPRYSVIVPRGLSYKAPVGFALPEGQPELLSFLNTWFDLKQKNGVLKQFYEHWILGKDDSSVEPRWSVLRNVLGIGVEKPLQPGDDTSSTD